jgi:surface carbohydrate biosynthesis protein
MELLRGKYKWLILPIETKVRELDGKILLAAMAAERGWGVILGHKDTIVSDSANIDGIVLEKDGHAGNYRINQFFESGKKVCIMDEEGLVYHNGQDYYRRRLNPKNHQMADFVFLWGEVQRKDVAEQIPIPENKLVLTGNPRFDLLRPEFRQYYSTEALRLKNKYGPFILVNTNFGESNHYMGTDWLLNTHRKSGFIANVQDEADELAYIEYQSHIADSFREMIPVVSARYPQYQIVIRPHPSENHQTWRLWARNIKRVSVIHKGDVNPWLLAADLSIHNSCMTGIQGFLLDKPVITYMTTQSDQFDFYLPNAISIRTTSQDEILTAIGRIADQPNSHPQQNGTPEMQIAEQYMTAMTGPFAADRIINAIETMDVKPESYQHDTFESKAVGGDTRKADQFLPLNTLYKKFRTRISEARLPKAQKIQVAYARQKFPGINLQDVQKRFARLQVVTGRFTSVRICQLGANSFGFLPK